MDDCTRLRVLRLYDARNGQNAVAFVAEMVAALPFPIQRIQSDRGAEFLCDDFQNQLRARKIKLRPNRPRAPHLNGKVERSQQTDRAEFWSTVDRSQPREALAEALAGWERHYNEARGHSAHQGKTPRQRFQELKGAVPSLAQVQQGYDETRERWHTNSHHSWVADPRRAISQASSPGNPGVS